MLDVIFFTIIKLLLICGAFFFLIGTIAGIIFSVIYFYRGLKKLYMEE